MLRKSSGLGGLDGCETFSNSRLTLFSCGRLYQGSSALMGGEVEFEYSLWLQQLHADVEWHMQKAINRGFETDFSKVAEGREKLQVWWAEDSLGNMLLPKHMQQERSSRPSPRSRRCCS